MFLNYNVNYYGHKMYGKIQQKLSQCRGKTLCCGTPLSIFRELGNRLNSIYGRGASTIGMTQTVSKRGLDWWGLGFRRNWMNISRHPVWLFASRMPHSSRGYRLWGRPGEYFQNSPINAFILILKLPAYQPSSTESLWSGSMTDESIKCSLKVKISTSFPNISASIL